MYYTLLTQDEDGVWHPQFGDYDRQTVVDEAAEYDEKTKIISSGDWQSQIQEAIDELNAKQA